MFKVRDFYLHFDIYILIFFFHVYKLWKKIFNIIIFISILLYFQRSYNVHNVKTTSYGRQNNVVCVLGIHYNHIHHYNNIEPFEHEIKSLHLLQSFRPKQWKK